MGLNLYELPGYQEVVRLLYSNQENSNKAAYFKLRKKCSSFLNERELRLTLRKIQVNEGFIHDFLKYLYKTSTGMTAKAIAWFSKDQKELVLSVKRELPGLKVRANEVSRTMDVPKLGHNDAEEVFRRLREKIPNPSTAIINKYIQKNESMRGGDDQVLSFTEFFQKWVLLYVVYGITRSLAGLGSLVLFTGGIGLFGFTLIHLPFLVMMLDDLLYKVGQTDYVVP